MRYVLMLVAFTGCIEAEPETVVPEISGAAVEIDDGELVDLAIELQLKGHGDGDSLVAVERVELFADPVVDDAEPLVSASADFEPGFDRFVSPDETRSARLVSAGSTLAAPEACDGQLSILVCIWGVQPDAPLTAGCDLLSGVTPVCR